MSGGPDIADDGLVNLKAAIGTLQNDPTEARQRKKPGRKWTEHQ